MITRGLPSAEDLDAVAEEQWIAAETAAQPLTNRDDVQDAAAGER